MILTAVLTHLDPGRVQEQLDYLRSVTPAARFVVCHGGRRSDFDKLSGIDGVFLDDPSLRGPHFDQSINQTLSTLCTTYVRDDPGIEYVYLIEYDHLILLPDFEAKLIALAQRADAGLLAKRASPRNDSNWSHFVKSRHDGQLNKFIAGVSTREDPEQRWGCLGTGMLFRRDALLAFCALEDPPPSYFELFVPTAVHHLGFKVVDVDALSDLYSGVRWMPEYNLKEVRSAKRAGRTFLHPFKRLEALEAIRAAPGPPPARVDTAEGSGHGNSLHGPQGLTAPAARSPHGCSSGSLEVED